HPGCKVAAKRTGPRTPQRRSRAVTLVPDLTARRRIGRSGQFDPTATLLALKITTSTPEPPGSTFQVPWHAGSTAGRAGREDAGPARAVRIAATRRPRTIP